LAGYTSKTPGTEDGITEPSPTFSTCFGQPFIILHPARYATMLAEKMKSSGAKCWLVNTGWVGGKFGVGKRCPLKITRSIIDKIHDGSLAQAEFTETKPFKLAIPKAVEGLPDNIINPVKAWPSEEAYYKQARSLAGMFETAFERVRASLQAFALVADQGRCSSGKALHPRWSPLDPARIRTGSPRFRRHFQ
jgi:phosphoenolpyruvate carboxykinase (ATP)